MIDALRDWWGGIWALLERSLRNDARQLSQHLFRLLAVLAIYVAVIITESSGMLVGAPGLRYFRQLAYLNTALISLAAMGYFSSAITEEKEEDTLGLMLMAGISPLGILLGKSSGRLVQAALLLTVQFPFTWLAVTLGGVTRGQIVQTYVALLAYLVCQANVALVCSVIARRNRDAAALTFFWQIMYFALPEFARIFRWKLATAGWAPAVGGWQAFGLMLLDAFSHSTVVYQLQEILMTGVTTYVVNAQVLSNFGGGLAAFLLAWWLFPLAARHLSPDPTPRGLISFRVNQGRWFGAGRVWGHAIIWKDFHFSCGGISLAVIKVLGHAALFGFIAYQNYEPLYQTSLNWRDVASMYFGIAAVLTVFDAAWSIGRVLHEEIKTQTWSTLVMLPRSLPEVAYSKVAGALLSLAPSLACLSLVPIMGYLPWQNVVDFLEQSDAWVVTAMGLSLIHLTALYSTLVKWGALPLAIASLIFLFFVWQLGFMMVMIRLTNSWWLYSDLLNSVAVALLLLGCATCHLLIGLRLKGLAGR